VSFLNVHDSRKDSGPMLNRQCAFPNSITTSLTAWTLNLSSMPVSGWPSLAWVAINWLLAVMWVGVRGAAPGQLG
jgi:hypothetical protein